MIATGGSTTEPISTGGKTDKVHPLTTTLNEGMNLSRTMLSMRTGPSDRPAGVVMLLPMSCSLSSILILSTFGQLLAKRAYGVVHSMRVLATGEKTRRKHRTSKMNTVLEAEEHGREREILRAGNCVGNSFSLFGPDLLLSNNLAGSVARALDFSLFLSVVIVRKFRK